MAALLDLLTRPILRRSNFSGSLAFIDSLPTKRPISVRLGLLKRWREAFAFSNPVPLRQNKGLPSVSAISTYKPSLQRGRVLSTMDARVWNPFKAELKAQKVAQIRAVKMDDPWKVIEEVERRYKRSLNFWWNDPRYLTEAERLRICAERERRRQIMHALRIAGKKVSYPTRTVKSKVICP